MQQDHTAVMPLLFDPPQDDVCSWLGPVLRVDVLKDYKIVEVFSNFQRRELAKLRRAGVSGVRGPKQRSGATSDRFQQQLRGVQLKPDVLRPAKRQVRMVVSMVPDLVAFINNASNERGITLGVDAHQKERRLHVRCFKNVEDLWRPARIGTVVKRDRNLVLATGPLVIERGK